MSEQELPLQQISKHVNEIALRAGEIMLEGASSEKELEFKSSVDIVTNIDKKVENFIKQELSSLYPSFEFLGEEEASVSGEILSDKPTWVVDPIDGTTNFVHNIKFSAVSIALVVNKLAVVGAVYNPYINGLYHAYKGNGAFYNEKQIFVSKTECIADALVHTNVGYDRSKEGVSFMMANLQRVLLENVRSIRMGGSAALELCRSAEGKADAFYEFGIHSWDIAASCCIIEEAGGKVLDISGKPVDLLARRVLGGTPKVVDQLAKLLHVPEDDN